MKGRHRGMMGNLQKRQTSTPTYSVTKDFRSFIDFCAWYWLYQKNSFPLAQANKQVYQIMLSWIKINSFKTPKILKFLWSYIWKYMYQCQKQEFYFLFECKIINISYINFKIEKESYSPFQYGNPAAGHSWEHFKTFWPHKNYYVHQVRVPTCSAM